MEIPGATSDALRFPNTVDYCNRHSHACDRRTGCLGETGLNIYGDVKASSVDIAGSIDISLSGTSPSVYICDSCLAVDISGLNIDMDFGALDFIDFLVNPIVNAIVGVFEGQIEAEL